MALFDQFPYTNMHEINLDWVISQIKTLIGEWQSFDAEMRGKYQDLVDYVNNYFDNLDLSDEIREVIDQMIEDGTFTQIIAQAVADVIGGGINFYGVETSHIETAIGNYWLVEIPRTDITGAPVELKVGIADGTETSPTWITDPLTVSQFAVEKKATVAMNAGFFDMDSPQLPPMGSVIIDGEILINQYDTHTDPIQTLGIMPNGDWRYYDSRTVNAVEMQDDGVKYAVGGLGAMITAGAKTADLPTWNSRYGRGMWQTIGCNDDRYFIITTETRKPGETGYSLDDIANIYLTLGATEAYICDGGGSTSTTVESIKLNTNRDAGGLEDRKVVTFFYISKPDITADPDRDEDVSIARAIGNVLGFMRTQGAILKRYRLLEGEPLTDCNDLPLNSVGYTYSSSLNSPGSYYHIFTYGYSEELKVQIAIRHTDSKLVTRGLQGGTWREWRTCVGWNFPTGTVDPDTLTPECSYQSPVGNTHNPDSTGEWHILTLGNPSSDTYSQIAIRGTTGRLASRIHTSSGWGRWSVDLGGTITVTSSSTGNLMDLGLINGVGYYLVIMQRTGSYEDAASIYTIRYTSGNFVGRTVIHEGSQALAPRMDANGAVHANGSTTSNVEMAVRVIRFA